MAISKSNDNFKNQFQKAISIFQISQISPICVPKITDSTEIFNLSIIKSLNSKNEHPAILRILSF